MSESTQPGFYDPQELRQLGFAEVGQAVLIDRTCQIFGAERIRLGSHVRIDSFGTLSAGQGGITIGNYVHLSTAVGIAGAGSVVIEDFCGLSSKVSIFSTNEDYSGGALTNPMIPAEFRGTTSAPVHLKKHALIGCSSVILPGVTVGLGASVGALSLVNKSVPDWMIVSGNPLRRIGRRNRDLLQREKEFLSRQADPSS